MENKKEDISHLIDKATLYAARVLSSSYDGDKETEALDIQATMPVSVSKYAKRLIKECEGTQVMENIWGVFIAAGVNAILEEKDVK